MKKHFSVITLFTLLSSSLIAQNEGCNIINGKVVAASNQLEGIFVINLQSKEQTKTLDGGYFSIPVQVGDTLMFSSIRFKGIKIPIKENHLLNDLIFVKMTSMFIEIKEVTVFQYKNINAVALGIIPKGQKTYTPAERKYNLASNTYATGNIDGSSGGSIILDPLINLFSGRSAMLKKEIEVEKKELLIQKTEQLFDEPYFINRLKIPKEYIKGFQFYLAENNKFAATMKTNNKTMITFLLGELATNYLAIIAIEKK